MLNPVNILPKAGRSTLTCMHAHKGYMRSIPLASMHSTATIARQPILSDILNHQQSDPLSQAEMLSTKAQQYFERGLFAPMVANLQAAIQLAPKERGYYAQLANGLIRMKRIEEAARVLGQRAELIDSEQAMGLYASGREQIKGGDFHSALDCLNSAVSLQPSSATFLKERAAVHFKMNAFAEGVKDYVDAVFCANVKNVSH
eukprot:Phypoly_transcript_16098.p1 GENE.Phypoly_transcript_16098~~Phypoly_transcript_16098.p1  ORF type:complete len:202 (+),score=27.71 Phypoly_transcript_16098:253-858(+)